MYRLSDTYNLDTEREPPVKPHSPYALYDKLLYESIVLPSSARDSREKSTQHATAELNDNLPSSVGSHSLINRHIARKNGLIRIIDKSFDKTARTRLIQTQNQFRSQTLEQRILGGEYLGKHKSSFNDVSLMSQ